MVNYPNGKRYTPTSHIKNRTIKKQHSYSNRGMTLEEDINETNIYYRANQIAVIHKKPTPVQIVQVNYPRRSAAVITEAYFKQASTTDYNGIYKGKYIDFEAKETRNKSSFPLQNFHDHQIDHMKAIIDQKGLCFVLLSFSMNDDIYLLDAKHLLHFWNDQKQGGRKSIPLTSVKECGHKIEIGYHPRIDYLKVLDKIYFS